MNAELIPLWGMFTLMISYGIFLMILTKSNLKFRTSLVDYADNIHDKIEPLGDSIRESNKINADLADLMEELVDGAGVVQKQTPQISNLVPSDTPMGIVTNLFINHMLNKRAEHNGSTQRQEREIYEIPQEYETENDEFSTEETQNSESSSEDITTG